ncbi:ATP-binding protein [Rhodococcus sp. ACPA1]|uniref:ATP-binding protein n=1 Tax=Rhodococcus sp. ACPA1 TaxID=2028572 RepID=UPI0027BA86F5|nr:ATP-binding protein [Rhodococcus sp. ACPA1]
MRKAAFDIARDRQGPTLGPGRGGAGAAAGGSRRPGRRHLRGCAARTRISTGKTFSSWRPEESSIPEAIQNALTTLEWVHRRENLAVSGASGTGKSHFVEALAHAAIEADLRVVVHPGNPHPDSEQCEGRRVGCPDGGEGLLLRSRGGR